MQPWLALRFFCLSSAESKGVSLHIQLFIEYFACCIEDSLFKSYIVRNRDNQKISLTTSLISHVYVRDLMSKINLALLWKPEQIIINMINISQKLPGNYSFVIWENGIKYSTNY